MKKYIVLLFFVSFFTSFSFAQKGIESVTLRFCDDGTGQLVKNYTTMLDIGEKKDVCIYIENNWTETVSVEYDFSKWSLTNWWNQICDTTNDFSKFFVDNPNRIIELSSWETKLLKETINPPSGSVWIYYWCLAYKVLKKTSEKSQWMFDVVVRKANFFNLFVWSEDSIFSDLQLIPVPWTIYVNNKNIWVTINEDWDLLLNFAIKNNWNLPQNVSLEGVLYNFLGFEKPYSLDPKKILPWDVYNASVNLGIIPAYKWIFSVRVSLVGEPSLEFDATGIDEKFKQPILIKETASLFIFSWFYVILALVVLGLIVKIIVPKKKKIE